MVFTHTRLQCCVCADGADVYIGVLQKILVAHEVGEGLRLGSALDLCVCVWLDLWVVQIDVYSIINGKMKWADGFHDDFHPISHGWFAVSTRLWTD